MTENPNNVLFTYDSIIHSYITSSTLIDQESQVNFHKNLTSLQENLNWGEKKRNQKHLWMFDPRCNSITMSAKHQVMKFMMH